MQDSSHDWYPLRFRTVLRRYLWGGRRLETILGKPLPPGDDYAESWEVVDHGDDQSIVTAGRLEGQSLGSLCQEHTSAILGEQSGGSFPLLMKFLDANRDLSVQVHPNDAQGALLDPPDLGKTEAWYILHAEPGAKLYAGLKASVDREQLASAVSAGTTADCLHVVEAQAGDCVFIPAGTVHALGAGLMVAEIQQSSDTTYRLFDWNRVDANGQPRQLHIEAGMAVIDFDRGPVNPVQPTATNHAHCEQLVSCDKFVLRRWQTDEAFAVGGDNKPHILAMISGKAHLQGDPTQQPLSQGQSALLPAVAKCEVRPTEPIILLEALLP